MATETRLDLFNAVFLNVLKQLLDNIPHQTNIDPCPIADALGISVTDERRRLGSARTSRMDVREGFGELPNGDTFYDLFEATIDFMDQEDFLCRPEQHTHGRTPSAGEQCRITTKGIALLNIPLPGQATTVHDTLRSVASSGATEVRQAVISETVGAIMGAAARGFLGS